MGKDAIEDSWDLVLTQSREQARTLQDGLLMDNVLGPDLNTEKPSTSPIVLVHRRTEEVDCELKKLDDHVIESLGVMKQGNMGTIQKLSKETEDDSQGQRLIVPRIEAITRMELNPNCFKILQNWVSGLECNLSGQSIPIFWRSIWGRNGLYWERRATQSYQQRRVGFQRGVVENYLIWWRLVPSPTGNHEYPQFKSSEI